MEDTRLITERSPEVDQFLTLALDILIIAGFDGYLKEVSSSAERTLGFTQAEFKERPYIEFVHPEDRAAALAEIERSMKGGVTVDFEVRCITKDGSTRWISWSGRSNLETQLIYAVGHDVTEHKKLDQARSDFVNFMSHQLKTPLVEMTGYMDNMMEGLAGALSSKQVQYLGKMKKISVRSLRLVSDLLNISKIERGMLSVKLLPVNLSAVLSLALEEYAELIRDKGLVLQMEKSKDEIWLLADSDRLVEALKNLINNAEKFTEKGSISITMRGDEQFGYVDIADSGSGIADDVFLHLFNKEWALSGAPRPKGGAGLGLYIAKSFLALQHGELSAERLPGGTKFTVKLPRENR